MLFKTLASKTLASKTLVSSLALAAGLIAGNAFADANAQESTHQVQQIRNVTVKITYGDTTFNSNGRFFCDGSLSLEGTEKVVMNAANVIEHTW